MKRKWLVPATIYLLMVPVLWAGGIIESAQQALKDQGFYYGEITGQKDADTITALRRYQIRNGLNVTGELDADTQRSLGLIGRTGQTETKPEVAEGTEDSDDDEPSGGAADQSAPSPESSAPSQPGSQLPGDSQELHEGQSAIHEVFEGTPYEAAPPNRQQRVIADAQMTLSQYDCYHGQVDGVYGPGTELAIRAYQSQIGLAVTGRFDLPTLAALGLLPGQRVPSHRRVVAPRPLRPIYRGEWIHE